jgi:hypothetical protein
VGGAGVLVAAVVAITVTLSSSSVSGDPAPAGGTGARSADLGVLVRSYTTLVATYETAERTWKARAQRMVAGSASSAEALIRPTVQFADTVDQVDRDLVDLSWPPSLRGDATALEADLATVSGDLRSIGGQRVSSMSQWISNVNDAAARSSAASNRLRRALGGTTIAPS